MKVTFLGSSRHIYIDALSLEEASSESTSIVYDLHIMREEGRDCKGGTEGCRGGGILVSLVVRFKLYIRLARL